MSLAFRIAYGSNVFLVVLTSIEPSIKSSVHPMPCGADRAARSAFDLEGASRPEGTHVSVERTSNLSPRFTEILLSVLREENGEGGLLEEGAARVVVRGEGFDLPLDQEKADTRMVSTRFHSLLTDGEERHARCERRSQGSKVSAQSELVQSSLLVLTGRCRRCPRLIQFEFENERTRQQACRGTPQGLADLRRRRAD